MRPVGVTNHISRIAIPNIALDNDADFQRLIELIAAAQDAAVDAAMSCEPDRLVLGISAETFWDGLSASRKLKTYLMERTGLPVSMGAEACDAALALFNAKRLAIITPYQPVGDANVRRFFEESGYEVRRIKGLRCASPVAIAHVSEAVLAEAVRELDGDDIDAILQVGTNLAMARLAGSAQLWLRRPVLAINTAIYWHALRESGITDRMSGFGPLLERH
jgi:maleate isomerase